MYTLRTASSNVLLFEVQASDFLMLLEGHGKEREFNRWQKIQDQQNINRLASSVYNTFRGMNIDGKNSDWHMSSFSLNPDAVSGYPLLNESRMVVKPPR